MDVRRNSQGHELNAGCHPDRGIFHLIRTYLLPRHNEPNDFEGEETARQPAHGSFPLVTTKQRSDSALINPRPKEFRHVVVTRKRRDRQKEQNERE